MTKKLLVQEAVSLLAVVAVMVICDVIFHTSIPAWAWVTFLLLWIAIRVQDITSKRRKNLLR